MCCSLYPRTFWQQNPEGVKPCNHFIFLWILLPELALGPRLEFSGLVHNLWSICSGPYIMDRNFLIVELFLEKARIVSISWLPMVPDLDQGDVILLTILLTLLSMMMIIFACVALKCCILSCTRNHAQVQQPASTNLINLAIQCEANRPMGRQNQRQDRILEV